VLAQGTPEEVVLESLKTREPARFKELVIRSGLGEEEAIQVLEGLSARKEVFTLSPKWPNLKAAMQKNAYFISASGWERILRRLVGLLEEYHQLYPLRKGMPREELKSRLRMSTEVFNEAITRAVTEGKVVEEGALLRLPSHRIKFTPQQQRLVEELLAHFRENPYVTPSVAECERKLGEEVFNALLDMGILVKVNPDVVFLADTYREMVRQVVERLEREGRIKVAQVRDMFRTSRKYALALMEHLDEEKITKRVGDERILLRKPVF